MKLSSTPKPIRFSFEMDGKTYRSLDAIKTDFKPFALKAKIDDGSFLRWLEQQNEAMFYEKIRNLQNKEVGEIVEYVYGWKDKELEGKLHNTKDETLIAQLLSYGIKRGILSLVSLEKYYLQIDASNPLWIECEEKLQKSKNPKVINKLAAEYKQRGNIGEYGELMKYAAEKLNDEDAKQQLKKLNDEDVKQQLKDAQAKRFLDGLNYNAIRRQKFVEILSGSFDRWWSLVTLPNRNEEEERLSEFLKVAASIIIKVRQANHYFPLEEYKETVESAVGNYRSKEDAMHETLEALIDMLIYAKSNGTINSSKMARYKSMKAFKNMNFKRIPAMTTAQVIQSFVVSILYQ